MPDLASLDTLSPAEQGAVVELENPVTGEIIYGDDMKPWSITIRGEDSASVRQVVRKQHDKRSEKIRKGRDWGFDSETIESETIDKLVAATIGWSGLVLDGKPFEYSVANARKLYGDERFPWIVEQVQKAMGDRKRFFKKAS